ncbi:glycosyltransferase [Poseidonibacter antarcticus]|uniref:glycosyltransferase n=1 Tax=Poseidonibacter antarcticus TaxID=2478538 RepID=UPI000EF55A5F|nr:glycosyltransferase [Poseidonibacter antarcticus]
MKELGIDKEVYSFENGDWVNKPLVSIVVPTHNRSQMMQRAIKSLLEQTYQNIEILVCDDGSSDDTQAVLKIYEDKRIIILKNETPKGACSARNIGIFKANGEFITFLDDDDEFLPTRIEEMVNAWDDRWAYIATGLKVIKSKNKSSLMIPNKIISLNSMLFKMATGISNFTKTKRIVELGGFDESLFSSQDTDIWIRLNIKYRDGYAIQKPLYIVHTEHDKPRITTSSKKIKGHFDFYKKHKSIMNKEQRKAKLFELLRYKNKKISILKALNLGNSKSNLDILKYIVKSRIK